MHNTSFLELLEQTKGVFLQENFILAMEMFKDVALVALPDAPDIWIDAMYGMAECQRLKNNFYKALGAYGNVLHIGYLLNIEKGRLADSNRVSIIESFLAFSRICRLSLRVPNLLIKAILDIGKSWASNQIGEKSAQLAFFLEELMIERNMVPLEMIINRLEELSLNLRFRCPELLASKHVIADIRLAETVLDAGFLKNPPEPPKTKYYARNWVHYMSIILTAKWNIMNRKYRTALALLENLPCNAEYFSFYKDLWLNRMGLYIEAKLALGHHSQSIWIYSDRILKDIKNAGSNFADLSSPMWHLIQLILLFIRYKQNFLELNNLYSILGNLLEHNWLKEVLYSRNFRERETEKIIDWCKNPNSRAIWKKDKADLLEKLAKVVRP